MNDASKTPNLNLQLVFGICSCRSLVARYLAFGAEALSSISQTCRLHFSWKLVEQACLQSPPIGMCMFNLGSRGVIWASECDGGKFVPDWKHLTSPKDDSGRMFVYCCTPGKCNRHSSTLPERNNGSKYIFVVDSSSGNEVKRVKVNGNVHCLVHIESTLLILTANSDHELIAWDSSLHEIAWQATVGGRIEIVECPRNDIVVCVVEGSLLAVSALTGGQLFKHEALLSTPEPGLGDFAGHCGFCSTSSEDLMFIGFEHHYYDFPDEHDPGDYSDFNTWHPLFLLCISLETGNILWRHELEDAIGGTHLAFSKEEQLLFVTTDWGCTDPYSEIKMYNAAGQLVRNHHTHNRISHMQVIGSLVVMVTDQISWPCNSEDKLYKITIQSANTFSKIFSIEATEEVADVLMLNERILAWVSFQGNIRLVDVLLGTDIWSASLGSEAIWSIRHYSSEVVGIHEEPWGLRELEQWLEVTLRLLQSSLTSHHGAASVKLRWLKAKEHMPAEYHTPLGRMLAQNLAVELD